MSNTYLEADLGDILEALCKRGLAEFGGVGREGDCGEDGAVLGVHLEGWGVSYASCVAEFEAGLRGVNQSELEV